MKKILTILILCIFSASCSSIKEGIDCVYKEVNKVASKVGDTIEKEVGDIPGAITGLAPAGVVKTCESILCLDFGDIDPKAFRAVRGELENALHKAGIPMFVRDPGNAHFGNTATVKNNKTNKLSSIPLSGAIQNEIQKAVEKVKEELKGKSNEEKAKIIKNALQSTLEKIGGDLKKEGMTLIGLAIVPCIGDDSRCKEEQNKCVPA